MMVPSNRVRVLVSTQPVDFRKGHDGLAAIVSSVLRKGFVAQNSVGDSLFESSVVARVHEQLVPYDVQDQELAFVQHGAEAARFSCNLV